MGKRLTKKEFLKDLWHPAEEKPKSLIIMALLACIIIQENCQIRRVLYNKKHMNWKCV